LGGDTLGDVEEAGDVDAHISVVVFLRELDKWLGNEDPGIVYERVNAAEAF